MVNAFRPFGSAAFEIDIATNSSLASQIWAQWKISVRYFRIFSRPSCDPLQHRLDALAQIMDSRFKEVDTRFEAVDTRFEAMSKSIDARFDRLSSEIGQIRAMIDVDRRLARLESKQVQATQ